MPHVLIVETDAACADHLATLARFEGCSTAIASSLEEARQQLVFRRPDVVLLDPALSEDSTGEELVDVNDDNSSPEIILMNAPFSIESPVGTVAAAEHLLKPIDVQMVRHALSRIGRTPLAHHDTCADVISLKDAGQGKNRYGRLWGRSAPMQRVFEQIRRVAPTSATVLIVGESGTGKELVAQTIHDMSRRAGQPFLAVNCGAISAQLIESEMFGHEKGSFTGATRQHKGYFERSHGGTLFLDEITEMPAELQVKLLRVLETGTFMRVGSDEPLASDVRIVAATNRVPREAVECGRLREDLYYRLSVFPLATPTLRERPDDVEPLCTHFLDELNREGQTSRTLTPGAIARLNAHAWPGNVRELRNVLQRAYIMAESDEIGAETLRFDDEPARPATVQPGGAADGAMTVSVGTSIAEVERSLILATLERVDGDKRQAAEMLGISLKTLYNRLREYGAARLDEIRVESLRSATGTA